MHKKYLLVAFGSFCFGLIHAQSDFLKDPDIVWAIEMEEDWVLDIPSFEQEWEHGIITLKQLRSQENELHWSSPYLVDLLFEAVKNGDLPVYKDPAFKIPEDPKTCFQQPTATYLVFDPVTYEEKVMELSGDIDPFQSIKAWRLKQIFAYHKKKASWTSITLAIAPLTEVQGLKKDTMELRPLFWIKPGPKRPKLTSKHITLAKKTFTHKRPEREEPVTPSVLLKTMEDGETPVSHLLQVFATDMKSPFYDSQGSKLLSPLERKNMLSKMDTVMVFDPETYETSTYIENKGISPARIDQLRLVQTWYWDAHKKQLSVFLDAVAPIKQVVDQRGRFWCGLPWFYRKVKQ